MTDPKHAQHIPGLGRWYTHPVTGETWPSVTNVLSVGVAKPALAPWAAKSTAAKAWELLPQMVASSRRPVCKAKRVADRCGTCSDCITAAMKKASDDVRDKAADLGTRVHALAEAEILGKPIAADPEAEPFAAQARRFLTDWGINPDQDVEATEITVVNRTAGYAGTADLLVRLVEPGKRAKRLCVVDYQSSTTRPVTSVYPEHGMQLAALAHAETVLLDNGEEIPMPKITGGLYICNLRVDNYSLIPMPMNGTSDDAYAGFLGVLATAKHIYDQHGHKPQPAIPPNFGKAAA